MASDRIQEIGFILRQFAVRQHEVQSLRKQRQAHLFWQRLWFICPFSKRWVRALYLPPGGSLWGSRHAYPLTYRSRRESGQGRALVRMLTRFGDWRGDRLCAAALQNARDPLGFDEERKCERREEARQRRNQVRAIARRQLRV